MHLRLYFCILPVLDSVELYGKVEGYKMQHSFPAGVEPGTLWLYDLHLNHKANTKPQKSITYPQLQAPRLCSSVIDVCYLDHGNFCLWDQEFWLLGEKDD